MTNQELSDKELDIYRKVSLLQGTMDEKTKEVKASGAFDKYGEIHKQYLDLIKSAGEDKEIDEGITRITFLNWHHMIEPSCFTGIWELNGDTIHESYSILNDRLKSNKVDEELKWMPSYYSANDWTILSFSEKEMPCLTAFVKGI